jgi:dihydroorotate dehydrogenase
VGRENIELISDRPIENWLGEFKRCKDQNPNGILIASIMEEYNRDAWIEIIERCQDAGDGFELNFSCPHGLPERKMGSAMGEDPEILLEVCGWVTSAAKRPVWAKMTPMKHRS